jgi:hypothetical protein
MGQATLTVVWEVPKLLLPNPDGSWKYQLWWMHIPAHTGDTLHLTVHLPPGWKSDGPAPPANVSLNHDLKGTLKVRAANR